MPAGTPVYALKILRKLAMTKLLKRMLIASTLLALAGVVVLVWMLDHPASLAGFERLRWKAGDEVRSPLKVSFLGVSNVLLDDGETSILTDGFFSRPDKMQTFLGKVSPDLQAVTLGLKRAGISERTGTLAAVIPLHSHYDHAMDAPEVVQRTGAVLLGSLSTAMVGRGWGLDESRIRVASLGIPMKFGRFTVTLYPSSHAPTGFTGGEITEPLRPPVRASDYKEGQSYSALFQHDGRSLLITGSAGYVPNALKNVRADLVFLGIGGLGARNAVYRDTYWREVVATVKAKRVIPIHWEDFWRPPDQPMKPLPPPLDYFDVTMQFLIERGAAEGVEIRLPLEWQSMDVFAGLTGE